MEKNRKAFVSAGITEKDWVAVVLPQGPEMVTTFLSVSSLAPVAPLNPAYTPEEFAWYLRDLRCTVLITPDGYETPDSRLQGNSGSGPSGLLLPGMPVIFLFSPVRIPSYKKIIIPSGIQPCSFIPPEPRQNQKLFPSITGVSLYRLIRLHNPFTLPRLTGLLR